MRFFNRTNVINALAILAALCAHAHAQTTPTDDATPATLSGRVTMEEDDRPARGVVVMLFTDGQGYVFNRAARVKTDAEGRYRIPNVQPGRYRIAPIAPAHYSPDLSTWPPGRPITLASGEEVEDVNFKLTRGGVVTGRVTDADGRPIVGETVYLASVNSAEGRTASFGLTKMTDDRGVYRFYGLPAGSYTVSVGTNTESGMIRPGRRRHYPLTYHPGVTERRHARVLEVAAGREETNVDIVTGRSLKTYALAGRVTDASTGRPVPNVPVGYGLVSGNSVHAFGYALGTPTNARGEFRLDGLVPGRYALFAQQGTVPQWYSETVVVEVGDADASDLEIKLHKGASLSGIVQVEGVSTPAARARLLASVQLFANVHTPGQLTHPSAMRLNVAPDGSFHANGVRPGKLYINFGEARTKGLTLARLEHNGVAVRDGIPVADGAQVSGVRVVLLYGEATVRGQVVMNNLTLPPDAHIVVFARRLSSGDARGSKTVEPDARGRFVIENLAAGTYEFTARVFVRSGSLYQSAPQQVTVAEGGQLDVTLTLDSQSVNEGDAP